MMLGGITPPGEIVKYLPPFELIRHGIEISTVRGEPRVNVFQETFVGTLRHMIQGNEVDEALYAQTHGDFGNAVKQEIIDSARQHFVQVDESINRGSVESAREHFDMDGCREGRIPFGM
jgi:hypothetical protein